MKKINFKAIAQELSKTEMKQIKGGYGGGGSHTCGGPCPTGTECACGCWCSSISFTCV